MKSYSSMRQNRDDYYNPRVVEGSLQGVPQNYNRQWRTRPRRMEIFLHIAKTGSITEAAERMQMSYMRAWTLIKTMEACFRQPLVEARRGGSARGGATLTKAGTEVLKLYREMDAACVRATRRQWERLRRHLRHRAE